LLIWHYEFCEAAIQAHKNLRKHPNDRFVETIESVEMKSDFAAKAFLTF
jgi:hypothetical protein